MEHILSVDQFDTSMINKIFTAADTMQQLVKQSGGDSRLAHRVAANFFCEPSTRTFSSFATAMYRLGGNVIPLTDAKNLSVAKGESLEDTIKMLAGYSDIIIMRHPESGAAARAAAVSSVPIINAGDGGDQHPTQALLDLYTIQKETGRLDNLTVVFGTDLAHSRTIRSCISLLALYPNNHLVFVSPDELRVGDDIKAYLAEHNTSFEETSDMEPALKKADIVYWNRIQKERFTGTVPPQKFIITTEHLKLMKPTTFILNPLPRIDEIEPEVDTDPRAAYFRQAENGLYVRMALIDMLLSRSSK